MRRIVTIVLLATVALATAAACGRPRDTAGITWDGQALQSMGYAVEDLAPAGYTDGGPGRRHARLHQLFRHALHAEATVQTEDGLVTVVAQRGTVTELTGTTLTVRSADDVVMTWQLSDRTVVVVDRARSDIEQVSVGTEVGVAGARDGDDLTARLVVVPGS